MDGSNPRLVKLLTCLVQQINKQAVCSLVSKNGSVSLPSMGLFLEDLDGFFVSAVITPKTIVNSAQPTRLLGLVATDCIKYALNCRF
jgi:hypothetical protein